MSKTGKCTRRKSPAKTKSDAVGKGIILECKAPLEDTDLAKWIAHCNAIRALPSAAGAGAGEHPVQLADGIWLGGAAQARDIECLNNCGIAAILNLAGGEFEVIKPAYPPEWAYLEIDVLDSEDSVLLPHYLPKCYHFLDSCEKESKAVLVHCMMGMNRSATMCAAYLMVSRQWSLPDTIFKVTKAQPFSVGNTSFQRELVYLAAANNLLTKSVAVDEALDADAAETQQHEASMRSAWDAGAADRERLQVASRSLGLDFDIEQVCYDGGHVDWELFEDWARCVDKALLDALMKHLRSHS